MYYVGTCVMRGHVLKKDMPYSKTYLEIIILLIFNITIKIKNKREFIIIVHRRYIVGGWNLGWLTNLSLVYQLLGAIITSDVIYNLNEYNLAMRMDCRES